MSKCRKMERRARAPYRMAGPGSIGRWLALTQTSISAHGFVAMFAYASFNRLGACAAAGAVTFLVTAAATAAAYETTVTN